MKALSLAGILLTITMSYTPTLEARKMVAHRQNAAIALKSFGSCQALGEHLQKEFLSYYSHYEHCPHCFYAAEDSMMNAGAPSRAKSAELAAPAAIGSRASQGAGGDVEAKSVVRTNNQVANVDEADFVKFDGKFIYQLHGNQLKIIKSWPANSLNMLATIGIQGAPRELLIEQNRAIVISQNGSSSLITVLDTQNKSSPSVEVQFEVPGNYVTARKIGSTLRIISNDLNVRLNRQALPPESNGWLTNTTPAANVSAKDLLNIQPTVRIVGGLRTNMDILEDCKHVYTPEKSISGQMTRLITIDLKNRRYSEALAFLNPETVYASESAIYIAQQGWDAQQFTAIHKFSVNAERPIGYAASGKVNGQLINQFAMDEHKGYLRTATNGTEQITTGIFNKSTTWETVNKVQVLKQNGQTLEVVGRSQNLAKGERLYSARFDGDKGYLVTFRQVDPLFTMDLSNPRSPRMVGELKIPGFSTYIHMLGNNHLLTIGQDADEKTGRAKGLKLSVFDVSNFAKPKEVKSLIFNSSVSSEATYEHKAFSFYDDKGVLAIPVSGYVNGSQRSSVLLFKVSTKEIASSGEMAMSEMNGVRRSFFADDIIYAIGGSGVKAANLNNPASPIATLLFESRLATGW